MKQVCLVFLATTIGFRAAQSPKNMRYCLRWFTINKEMLKSAVNVFVFVFFTITDPG